jgi:hypothetical protein
MRIKTIPKGEIGFCVSYKKRLWATTSLSINTQGLKKPALTEKAQINLKSANLDIATKDIF